MTESQFIQWLKGFTEGVHHYNISPKQWDHLKEKLNKVQQQTKTHPYSTTPRWTTNTT